MDVVRRSAGRQYFPIHVGLVKDEVSPPQFVMTAQLGSDAAFLLPCPQVVKQAVELRRADMEVFFFQLEFDLPKDKAWMF